MPADPPASLSSLSHPVIQPSPLIAVDVATQLVSQPSGISSVVPPPVHELVGVPVVPLSPPSCNEMPADHGAAARYTRCSGRQGDRQRVWQMKKPGGVEDRSHEKLALPGRPRLELDVRHRPPNSRIGLPLRLSLNARLKKRRKVAAL
ncbi:hypothetical protein L2E82_45740 [Cichorium intybus]|uniref:Uncharacterized protein n=1 Tax=Cichorium intybus TaxID=13427 RepID=A0ACB8ZUT1_CICIN|nr:hypothetical protein L2E82_45740 [Cichorium intybus]